MKPLLRDEQQIETVGILKKVVPFDLLDQNVLENLTAKAEMRKFPRGTYVFRQGDPSLHLLFIIISGSAEILIINEQDEEV
ncbi:MAG TPA: cyclic nucleotide-binding domain-containing protein, partial [Candidatus Limnocylindrales bacterium]|nr:cyclic nucleotide-binding domain-containing protein [Candidatus Limnocylindrales bacterium]